MANEYYDAVVVGGGTAGLIVAGRLAERGINPTTGDRLKIAVIEGGSDWPIRDPGLRPGYGYPTRRRTISNVISGDDDGPESVGPDYRWPWEGENYKVLGGCSIHFGSNTFLQHPEDIHFYREASEVNWTYGDFLPAIQEIEEMYNVSAMPEGTWCKAVHLFNEAAASLGYDVFPTPVARKNCLDCGFCGSGHVCRYDSKGNSLWGAYIGLNHGLKIIANATAEKILIEKVPGRGPVATGVIYTDLNNRSHEVRAARIIMACGTYGTPLLMFKSGYGPRKVLGSNLIVENSNVGEHLDGDSSFATEAMWSEAIRPSKGMTGFTMFTTQPRPYPALTMQFRGTGLTRQNNSNKFPHLNAFHELAPQFGWKHKEFMRNHGWLQFGSIKSQFGTLPWKWRITPTGGRELVGMDEARIHAVRKEASDIAVALYEKMPLKPVTVTHFDVGSVESQRNLRPGHNVGTCRAGASREVAVCDSDFNCFDIENLLFTSGASIPRSTFCHGCGPIAVGAAYAWRRILANHFSTGSSTKDFA